ncbi:Laminoacid oxidaselike [Caligus rogercresseyi]|uniref:Laminoacid oxidaselike n=1 Tax=Caligus rogercresseyi TaxID=217165 RepID=A0A7T8QS88_CALRO|nr:Laminoacid oxidaselike [Caligus rogercresseyi]
MTPLPTVVSKFSFTPLLSNSKRYALRHARLSGSVKVVLTFNTPFWEKLGIKGGKVWRSSQIHTLRFSCRVLLFSL